MKEHNLNGHSLVVVEGENKFNVHVHGNNLEYCYDTSEGCGAVIRETLPSGQWELLGRAGEISEGQWNRLVEYDRYYDGDPPGLGIVYYYRDYPESMAESCLFTATESGHSFCKANNIDLNSVLILKK